MIPKSLCRSWAWLLGLGIAFVVLGTAAIMLPFATTLSAIIVLGTVLIISGIIQLFQSFKERLAKRKFLYLILGLLSIAIGIYFIVNPLASAVSLTLILAIFLMMSGLFKIILSLALEYKYWPLLLINGIISVFLGIFIYAQWPLSGFWIIGLFVGIDLILNGWSLIMFSWSVHKGCVAQQSMHDKK